MIIIVLGVDSKRYSVRTRAYLRLIYCAKFSRVYTASRSVTATVRLQLNVHYVVIGIFYNTVPSTPTARCYYVSAR